MGRGCSALAPCARGTGGGRALGSPQALHLLKPFFMGVNDLEYSPAPFYTLWHGFTVPL